MPTGASSTCSGSSGPVYIRPPGFKHHAQEITRPRIKKKKKLFPVSNTKNSDVTYEIPGSDTFKKKEASTTKQKNTKRGRLHEGYITVGMRVIYIYNIYTIYNIMVNK